MHVELTWVSFFFMIILSWTERCNKESWGFSLGEKAHDKIIGIYFIREVNILISHWNHTQCYLYKQLLVILALLCPLNIPFFFFKEFKFPPQIYYLSNFSKFGNINNFGLNFLFNYSWNPLKKEGHGPWVVSWKDLGRIKTKNNGINTILLYKAFLHSKGPRCYLVEKKSNSLKFLSIINFF